MFYGLATNNVKQIKFTWLYRKTKRNSCFVLFSVCMYMLYGDMCIKCYVEVRWQFWEADSVLLHGTQHSNSDHQMGKQKPVRHLASPQMLLLL